MQVLVTGAGGFIGPAIVDALLRQNMGVRALVGAPGQAVRKLPSAVQSAAADICNLRALSDLTGGVDVVIHLAGPASVAESFDRLGEYFRVHVDGTATVLDSCRKSGLARFVYISSAEVYGRPKADPVSESNSLQARSPYAAAKIAAEKTIEAWTHSEQTSAIILRPFSIYGPGVSPRSVLGTILQQARGTEIVLQDLRPVRDYCYIEDLANAVVCACTVKAQGVYVVNVGTGVGTSVAELAKQVLDILGRDLPIREEPTGHRRGDADIYRLVADTRLANSFLNWRPTVSLRRGLELVLQAMRRSCRSVS